MTATTLRRPVSRRYPRVNEGRRQPAAGSAFTIRLKKPQPQSGTVIGWSVGDFLHTRSWNGASIVENWWRITVVGAQTTEYETYTVVKESGSAGYFPAGAAVINYGQAAAGDVLITSDKTDSPYLEIATHNGKPWLSAGADANGRKPYIRLGNLNGIAGITAGQWGLIAGDNLAGTLATTNKYMVASNLGVTLNNVGLTAYSGGVKRAELLENGNFRLGKDLTAATKVPSFAVFSVAETFNAGSSEAFSDGDILFGKNNAGNMLWDESAGALLFRGSTTTKLKLNSSGQLIAGTDGVIVDETGIYITDGSGSYPSLRLNSATALDSMIKFNLATVTKTQFGFVDTTTFLINNVTGRTGFTGSDVHFAYSTGSGRGKAAIYDATGYASFGYTGGTHPLEIHQGSSTIYAYITTGGQVVAKGGLYAAADPVGSTPMPVKYTGDLISEKNGGNTYTVYGTTFLTSPLTSGSWSATAYSTTAKTPIDTSAVFSGTPSGIKAAYVYVAVQDSGAAANDTYLILGPTNTALVGMACSPMPVNDRYGRYFLWVPCDSSGDFYYQIQASGASTFDVVMQIWGYMI